MKISTLITSAVVAGGLFGASLYAANNDSHTINFSIAPINELSVDEASLNLVIDENNVPTIGSDITIPAMGTVHVRHTTNSATNKRITVNLDVNMPGSTTLNVVEAEVAFGMATLSTTAQNLFTGITGANGASDDRAGGADGLNVDYSFTATVADAPASFTRTVTYILTDE